MCSQILVFQKKNLIFLFLFSRGTQIFCQKKKLYLPCWKMFLPRWTFKKMFSPFKKIQGTHLNESMDGLVSYREDVQAYIPWVLDDLCTSAKAGSIKVTDIVETKLELMKFSLSLEILVSNTTKMVGLWRRIMSETFLLKLGLLALLQFHTMTSLEKG